MRITDQNAATKTTAASTTVTFTGSDIPGSGVVAYHFLWTGAGMTTGDLTRIRVKANGNTIWDVPFAHLQAYQQRKYRSNLASAAADTFFSIWLADPEIVNEEAADQVQFPFGAVPTVELVIGAGGAAGTVQAGFTRTTVPPKFYPVFTSSQMNVAASTNNGRANFAEAGFVRGFSINTAGLTRLQLVLADIKRVEIEGVSLLREMQRNTDVDTVTDPVFRALDGAQSAPSGTSYANIDTAAGWAGVANELGIYALRPQA